MCLFLFINYFINMVGIKVKLFLKLLYILLVFIEDLIIKIIIIFIVCLLCVREFEF